ncbi:MAG: hypothetical protein A2033_17545 [Bacteroidetes bacterium GWA2_31_9]|nr:MAG: hypothetical protein A2033_17545 [Bacteroidetes bacterium GWA2_31_9]
MDCYSELDDILKLFKEDVIVKSGYPSFKYGQLIASKGTNGRLGRVEMQPSCQSDIFKDSILEYKGNYRFLHFTKYCILESIIKSKTIRMYELNHMEDKNELILGYTNFINQQNNNFINENLLKEDKSKLFSLSLNEYDEESITKEYMWEKYGDKGSGVCLDISIDTSNFKDWFRLYIGSIQYIEKGKTKLNQLGNNYNNFISKHNFKIYNISEYLAVLFSFYKTKTKFEPENEVRLLNYVEKDICCTYKYIKPIDDNISKTKFVNINLFPNNNEAYNRPLIRINTIIFGKDINYFSKKSNDIKELLKENFNYNPQIIKL